MLAVCASRLKTKTNISTHKKKKVRFDSKAADELTKNKMKF